MRDPGQVGVPRGARQRPAVIADTGWGRPSRAPHPPPGKVRASSRGGFASGGRGLLPGSSRFVGQGGRRSRGRGSHRTADGMILPARKRGSLRLFREPPVDAASFNVAPGRRFARFAIKPEPSREPLVFANPSRSRARRRTRLSASSWVDEPAIGRRRLRRPKRNGRPGGSLGRPCGCGKPAKADDRYLTSLSDDPPTPGRGWKQAKTKGA